MLTNKIWHFDNHTHTGKHQKEWKRVIIWITVENGFLVRNSIYGKIWYCCGYDWRGIRCFKLNLILIIIIFSTLRTPPCWLLVLFLSWWLLMSLWAFAILSPLPLPILTTFCKPSSCLSIQDHVCEVFYRFLPALRAETERDQRWDPRRNEQAHRIPDFCPRPKDQFWARGCLPRQIIKIGP